jgi:hypothetical protein
MDIAFNDEGTHCRVSINGYATDHEVTEFHSFDYDGHEGLTVEIAGVGSFISYDDGSSWRDQE